MVASISIMERVSIICAAIKRAIAPTPQDTSYLKIISLLLFSVSPSLSLNSEWNFSVEKIF
jgi:hypothetical protein